MKQCLSELPQLMFSGQVTCNQKLHISLQIPATHLVQMEEFAQKEVVTALAQAFLGQHVKTVRFLSFVMVASVTWDTKSTCNVFLLHPVPEHTVENNRLPLQVVHFALYYHLLPNVVFDSPLQILVTPIPVKTGEFAQMEIVTALAQASLAQHVETVMIFFSKSCQFFLYVTEEFLETANPQHLFLIKK